MRSPNLPHMHTTYLLTPFSLSHYTTLCLPSFSPLTTSSFPPSLDDIHCQVCQSPFDEHQMLLCDICNAGWHMDCLLPPFTTIPHGIWKCLLCLPHHLLPQTATLHLRLPSPILDFDTCYNLTKNDSVSLMRVSGLPITIYLKINKQNVFLNAPTRIAP